MHKEHGNTARNGSIHVYCSFHDLSVSVLFYLSCIITISANRAISQTVESVFICTYRGVVLFIGVIVDSSTHDSDIDNCALADYSVSCLRYAFQYYSRTTGCLASNLQCN